MKTFLKRLCIEKYCMTCYSLRLWYEYSNTARASLPGAERVQLHTPDCKRLLSPLGLCGAARSRTHTNANASDRKREPVRKVSHFAAFQSSNLVSSGLRIRITWHRVTNGRSIKWSRLYVLYWIYICEKTLHGVTSYHDHCSMRNDFVCSKSSVIAPFMHAVEQRSSGRSWGHI